MEQDACSALWLGDPEDDENGGALVARAASSVASPDAYAEARMTHLLALIGRQLVAYWSDQLSASSSSSSSASASLAAGGALLSDALPEVRQSLAAALKTLAQWEGALGDFMRTWPRWQGTKFSDAGMLLFHC